MNDDKKSKTFVAIALILFYIGIISMILIGCESQIIFVKGENNTIKAEEKEDIKVEVDSLKKPKIKQLLNF